MKIGQRVNFRIYDSLFKDIIDGTGILSNNIFGRLWRIKPDKHARLSGGEVQVHEDFIFVRRT